MKKCLEIAQEMVQIIDHKPNEEGVTPNEGNTNEENVTPKDKN